MKLWVCCSDQNLRPLGRTLVPLHTAHFLRAGVVAPDWSSDVTVCTESKTSNHTQCTDLRKQPPRHPAGCAVKPLGCWSGVGVAGVRWRDEGAVGGEHLVGQQWGGGQQSGFLAFLAHKGRMCVLATLRRTLMEEGVEGGLEGLPVWQPPAWPCANHCLSARQTFPKHMEVRSRQRFITLLPPVCFLSSISDTSHQPEESLTVFNSSFLLWTSNKVTITAPRNANQLVSRNVLNLSLKCGNKKRQMLVNNSESHFHSDSEDKQEVSAACRKSSYKAWVCKKTQQEPKQDP